jgi:HK97 family phage major capsid protein
MTEELFEDAPYVVDAINGDLVDELHASRQTTAVTDLLGTSGIATASVTTTAGKEAINILDGIIDAAADVEDATGIAPNAVIVTPAIWKTIRKAKNTLDEYMAGNPFAEQRYKSLFEMQFAKSADMTANHVLVGAFTNRAVELVSKADGVRVDSTNSNDTDFEKNLVSVRAESREVVAVKRPACFCDITVS